MEILAKSDEIKDQSGGYGDGEEEDRKTPNTLSPPTPSPKSSLGKRKKKMLKETMHAKSSAQSSKKIKKDTVSPKSIKVLSGKVSKSASLKRVNSTSKTPAMIRAEEIMSSLDPKFPSFLKTMVRSHVSSCFWMGLSTPFCKLHLPRKDMMLTVEDESGKEVQMKYFSERTGLSGGWRNFSIAHKLQEDDVVIFQLVEPHEPIKLKVYIIRANEAAKEDVSIGHIDQDANKKHIDSEKGGKKAPQKSLRQYTTKRKIFKSIRRDAVKKKETGLRKSVSKILQLENKPEKSNEENDIEIITGSNNSPSQVQFKDIKSFEDFTIIVDDLCIDSELPDDIRRKYYELCSAKKAFLHARLMQGLNSKLIAGIITEIVNIVDSIKTCNLSTCRGEFSNWERALKSFHFMGMSVGFINARIKKLVGYAFESKDALESRKYIAAKLERVRVEDELVNLKSKFVELEESYKKYGGDIKAMKSKVEGYEQKFQEEVDAPW